MKGMILAGGYGTRFLPASKTIPKEMFPLIDKPAIDFIVEEMVESGIKDILIVSSRRKKNLEDYFDREIELEESLRGTDKYDKLMTAAQKDKDVKIHFIRQQEMRGTGHAVLLGKGYLDGPFVLAFPDDLVLGTVPLSQQLINVYESTGKSVLAVKGFPNEDLSRYGVIIPSEEKQKDNIIPVKGIVEKPQAGTEPSHFASIGRYLLTSDVFPLLEEGIKNIETKEFFLTDALNLLGESNKLVACDFEGKRYDTGEPLGYLKTITEYALSRKDLKDSYLSFLRELI